LVNTLQNLLCKIIACRLQIATETCELLKKQQLGFVRGEEGVSQAACLLEVLQRQLLSGVGTAVCFLDLKKAYDMVPHKQLIHKLRLKGVEPKTTRFLEEMYRNTKLQVRIGDSTSNAVKYGRGVRQGCPTSPIIFNLYIDDLLNNIEPVGVPGIPGGLDGLCFADETVILASNANDLADKLAHIER